jgi:hypothetical protein
MKHNFNVHNIMFKTRECFKVNRRGSPLCPLMYRRVKQTVVAPGYYCKFIPLYSGALNTGCTVGIVRTAVRTYTSKIVIGCWKYLLSGVAGLNSVSESLCHFKGHLHTKTHKANLYCGRFCLTVRMLSLPSKINESGHVGHHKMAQCEFNFNN